MGTLYGFPCVPDPSVQGLLGDTALPQVQARGCVPLQLIDPVDGIGCRLRPRLELQPGDQPGDWLDQWRRGFKAKCPRPRRRPQSVLV